MKIFLGFNEQQIQSSEKKERDKFHDSKRMNESPDSTRILLVEKIYTAAEVKQVIYVSSNETIGNFIAGLLESSKRFLLVATRFYSSVAKIGWKWQSKVSLKNSMVGKS